MNRLIGSALVVLLLSAGPLVVFSRRLFQARRRGLFEYGNLAGAVGHQLELKWINRAESINQNALDVPDFSAATDLYQTVSNVYQIKPVPVELRDVIAVVVATLLPFLPVLLYVMPLYLAAEQTGGVDAGVAVLRNAVVATVDPQRDHGLERIHVEADALHAPDRHAGHRDRRAGLEATHVLELRVDPVGGTAAERELAIRDLRDQEQDCRESEQHEKTGGEIDSA